ncbi:MAG: hypothetical protein HY253_00675 [Burkholderiales bacterium]|nr:hypothetical protein [Burkholderiales bacterium]
MSSLSASDQLSAFVAKQKIGARFVITAPMLGLDVIAFDRLAQRWVAEGGPGFVLDGIPFRKVIDGQFYIQRLTVLRVASDE